MQGNGGVGEIVGEITSGGGGGGGSSSSGSSTAPSGPSQAEIRFQARLRAAFRDVLRRWGLRATKNLLNLIERGVRGQWSTTQFTDLLRHTPEYRENFRGIQWKTGMSEGQYLSTYAQYKARAQDIGEKLSRKEFGKILHRGIAFDEYSDRVDSLAAIDTYNPLWAQFKEVLDQRGIPVPGGKLGKKELSKFLMGLGSKLWEQVWQETFLTTSLERVAGVEVIEKGETATGDPYEITRADLLGIIKGVEALSPGFDVESLAGQDFAGIGQRLRKFKPNYLMRYGLTLKDILNMELGGPGAGATASKAERILAEQEAFLEPRVVPQQAALVGSKALEREELPQSL